MKTEKTYDHGNGSFTIKGSETDGLIVHKGTSAQPYQSWRVSHVESGLAVTDWLKTRRDAVAVRDSLLELGSWTRPQADLNADTEFREAYRLVLQDAYCTIEERGKS